MVPSTFSLVDSLPLTPNGKVDRKRLPAPEPAGGLTGEATAPRTETERALAELFAETLGAARVGIHDDFFDLGGYSLLAARLVVEVRHRFRVELPLSEFFLNPTVARLAPVIDEERGRTQLRSLDVADRLAKQLGSLTDKDVDSLLADPSVSRVLQEDSQ
jgi:acyl carrier protein